MLKRKLQRPIGKIFQATMNQVAKFEYESQGGAWKNVLGCSYYRVSINFLIYLII